ncbi:hypothetical protein EI94DRAFT_1707712 [Lactarius quietus]|nr:hypothetical protein EI94DRAFT_1707712 [Lactarius quietus]
MTSSMCEDVNQQGREPIKNCLITSAGRYLARCVHPSASVANIIYFSRSGDDLESSHLVSLTDYRDKETDCQCKDHFAALTKFCPAIKVQLFCVHVYAQDRHEGSTGLQRPQTQGHYRVAPKHPGVTITIPQNSRADWGFNNDDMGRMLIPVEYFQEYNDNPVHIRLLINAGDSEYNVTAVNTPAYLYEDPSKYNPHKIFRGLLRGPFLIRCFRALFLSPASGTSLVKEIWSTRFGLVKKYGINQITEPHIVYTAIQARFALGSQEIWSGQDATFEYEVFTNTLFELFSLDKTWTRETLAWWNVQIFGRSTGLASKTPVSSSSGGLVAMAKAELSWRANEESAERAAVEREAAERAEAERAAAERAAAILGANTEDNELEAGPTSNVDSTSRHRIPGEDDKDDNSEELPARLSQKRGVNATGSKQTQSRPAKKSRQR